MVNWKNLTDNPVDKKVRDSLIKYLLSVRKPIVKDYQTYLAKEVKGKSVLDIGICEHTQERMDSPKWKHRIILDNAKKTLGLDIDKKLIDVLKDKGYNVVHCDATSEANLEKKFDIIHIGDVIEHVNSPVALLAFARRHLSEHGKIIVRTPNPYNFNYIYIQRRTGTVCDNMEHLSYICPMHAHEIALRTDLVLKRYLIIYPKRFSKRGILQAGHYILKGFHIRHAFAEFFAKPEAYTTIYVYEFTLN